MKLKKLAGICCLIAVGTGSAIFGACAVSGPKPDDGGETPSRITSDWETMPENTNENLKYFGYFHSDGFRSQGSYVDEIVALENSNVLMINSCFDNSKAAEWLAKAKSVNQKVIFSVHGLFEGGELKKANSATLLEDYEQTLSGLKTALQSYIDDGTLLGFYFDEPAWNGVKEADFRTVTQWIRENIPSIKVITTMTTSDIGMSKTENYPEINASYNEYCTDVMYDYYGKWNDETRLTYLEKLKSKATNEQWIWGCATEFVDNAEQTDELYNAIRGMYTEAIQDERYAGIVSFSYADGLEGDWGYGLHTFLDNDSEYYDLELRKLYTDIGRAVIGADSYDYSSMINLTLVAPSEIYDLGEKIDLPAAGAVDGYGNEIPVSYKIVSPSGAELPVQSFTATESGKYEVTVTVEKNGKTVKKQCYISVRYKGEISTFDDEANLADAGGTDADTWCWPRQIDHTFYRTGGGSLKVTPHVKDGTWPRIIFERNGYQLWDLSEAGAVSMWVYNTSDTPIEGFSLMVSDENLNSKQTVYSTVTLPSKQWTEVKISVEAIKAAKPALDLTKVTVFYGNAASDYTNRAAFYIDDVTILEKTEEIPESVRSFETDADLSTIGDNADDIWTWPVSISEEQARTGKKSLKITVRQDGGKWPNVVFKKDATTERFDITKLNYISFYVYLDSASAEAITTFGLKINNGEGVKQMSKLVNLPARTWTEVKITKAEILAAVADIDQTQVKISYANFGSDYPADKSNFYIDDFEFVEAGQTEETKNVLDFESDGDIAKIGNNADDVWTWPVSVSTEQKHGGNKSLKITVRQDGGVWPNIVFKKDATTTLWNLTNIEKISVWVYFDSDNDMEAFAWKICNDNGTGGEANTITKTVTLKARQWTEISITRAEIEALAQGTNLDLTNVYVKIGQCAGTYTDRSDFYIDDFTAEEK